MLETCVVPAFQYGFGTERDRRNGKLQEPSRQHMGRGICVVKRDDKRLVVEPREVSGMNKHLERKVVTSYLRRAGYFERMSDESITKRARKKRE